MLLSMLTSFILVLLMFDLLRHTIILTTRQELLDLDLDLDLEVEFRVPRPSLNIRQTTA